MMLRAPTARYASLRGSAALIAIGVTALVFTAAMGLASVVLLSLRGAANIAAANAAYYAAEANVEKALYGLVGHTPGFEAPARAQVEEAPAPLSISEYLTAGTVQLPLIADAALATPATGASIARSRTARLPVDGTSWVVLKERSSTIVRLSNDSATAPGDPASPKLFLDLTEMRILVTVPKLGGYTFGTETYPLDPPGDYRINPWRGPQTDTNCYGDEGANPTPPDPIDPAVPANCPGHLPPGIVQADDPDVGLPIFPFIFASRPCSDSVAGKACRSTWTANSFAANGNVYQALPDTTDLSDYAMIVRDTGMDDRWTDSTTYLLEGVWPDTGIFDDPSNPRNAPYPMAGNQMFSDYAVDDPDRPTFPRIWAMANPGGSVPLTALSPEKAVYQRLPPGGGAGIYETVPGALSATGPAFETTAPDDYLYIDTCTEIDRPVGLDPTCTTAGTPDGRVSAPWNIEIAMSYRLNGSAGSERKALRRILDETSDVTGCVTSVLGGESNQFEINDLTCLFPEDRFPGFISDLTDPANGDLTSGYDADVRLTIATNTREVQFQLFLQSDLNAPPKGSDVKTTISTIGISGDSSQTLRTTVMQDETLPVFQKTTVF